MRALVTGGAGFIGSHVVDALVARGDEVTVLDDLSSGKRENLDGALDAGAELIEGRRHRRRRASPSRSPRPGRSVVFHLAAQIDVRRSVTDPVYDLGVNVGGTVRMLGAAPRRRRGAVRVRVHRGRDLRRGRGPGAAARRGRPTGAPTAPYGAVEARRRGLPRPATGALYGIETTVLRLGNVYGPRQDPPGRPAWWRSSAARCSTGSRPRVFGDGQQTRDYVYVGDVAAAFVAAAEARRRGPVQRRHGSRDQRARRSATR